MTPSPLNVFMWGALTMGSCVLAALFFRFWRRTQERLFAMFGLSFLVFAVNWLVLALANPSRESRHFVYFIRLAAFMLLLVGIIDKNRRSRS